MTKFMEQYTWEENQGEEHLRYTRVTGQDKEECLNLAVQEPLEINERRQRDQQPEQTIKHRDVTQMITPDSTGVARRLNSFASLLCS